MKITKIHKWLFRNGQETITLELWPSQNTPGFTHRLIANGQGTRKWLCEKFTPTAKNALALYNLHLAQTQP
jgi:hypothetical protein